MSVQGVNEVLSERVFIDKDPAERWELAKPSLRQAWNWLRLPSSAWCANADRAYREH